MAKAIQKKKTFKNDFTHFPVTMQQFQDLTNEILVAINEVTAPHALDADYAAQILMSDLHSRDHKSGYGYKSEWFEGCLNRISCHVTYHAVQEIQARIKAAAGIKDGDDTPTVDGSTDNVVALEEATH
jgi:hypothetical protein